MVSFANNVERKLKMESFALTTIENGGAIGVLNKEVKNGSK